MDGEERPVHRGGDRETENTSYDVQVRAINAEGTGAWSDSGSGTTDAAAALPTLSVGNASATEGSFIFFSVTLSAAASENVTVTCRASFETGDTAVAGDLTGGSGTATIFPGQTSGSCGINTTSDSMDEENETFTVTLSSPSSNAQIGTPSTAKGTIVDDDDCPDDNTTTCEVDVGGSVTGTIGTDTDNDWYAVVLEAGKRYQIDMEGAPTGRGTHQDPFLQHFDAGGNTITAFENDSGVGKNARLIYTPTVAGTYYVNAAPPQGTYTLSVIVLGANGNSEADTDFPATTATTGRVEVGASVTGNIDSSATKTGSASIWKRARYTSSTGGCIQPRHLVEPVLNAQRRVRNER